MIWAVVLAAGESRRMGCNKLLLPYAGTSVIRHIVKTIQNAGVGRILIVCGHKPDEIINELHGCDVVFTNNAQYKNGMLSSVRCGLMSLPEECEAVLLALGDHPTVNANVIRQLLAAMRDGAKIAVPKFGERRGHPLLFSKAYRDEILTDYDDCGLRGLLQAHSGDICEVQCDDESVALDMDTPEDYMALSPENVGKIQN